LCRRYGGILFFFLENLLIGKERAEAHLGTLPRNSR
jgi:hypothetical protein